MTTFNPQPLKAKTNNNNNDETYLEERIDLTVEPRERAFSQENIGRNDQSELIETRT